MTLQTKDGNEWLPSFVMFISNPGNNATQLLLLQRSPHPVVVI